MRWEGRSFCRQTSFPKGVLVVSQDSFGDNGSQRHTFERILSLDGPYERKKLHYSLNKNTIWHPATWWDATLWLVHVVISPPLWLTEMIIAMHNMLFQGQPLGAWSQLRCLWNVWYGGTTSESARRGPNASPFLPSVWFLSNPSSFVSLDIQSCCETPGLPVCLLDSHLVFFHFLCNQGALCNLKCHQNYGFHKCCLWGISSRTLCKSLEAVKGGSASGLVLIFNLGWLWLKYSKWFPRNHVCNEQYYLVVFK